jgi:hypothetical protein
MVLLVLACERRRYIWGRWGFGCYFFVQIISTGYDGPNITSVAFHVYSFVLSSSFTARQVFDIFRIFRSSTSH